MLSPRYRLFIALYSRLIIEIFAAADFAAVVLFVLLLTLLSDYLMPIFINKRSDGAPMNGLTRRKQWKSRPWASIAAPLREEWYYSFFMCK
ncbi:unnamed protein product [Caenorhabditis auriculariae]|uniref:Uncharacterized protein n=1 Tax=Caenorhabditis auriculariae TaxID=2777116 RepID=A0A8S1HFI4_9PELO|nr:unnamed protein product [Caenorhabditis auriculariae]